MATLSQSNNLPQSAGRGLQFRFDQGLDVVIQPGRRPVPLPDAGAMPAPDLPSQAALQSLLAAPDLDRRVDVAIRPRVEDPALLMPARFSAALRQARQSLVRAQSSRSQSGSAKQRRLRQAASVLSEQEELLSLLWTYQHALQQG
jgi:hypothetical protein